MKWLLLALVLAVGCAGSDEPVDHEIQSLCPIGKDCHPCPSGTGYEEYPSGTRPTCSNGHPAACAACDLPRLACVWACDGYDYCNMVWDSQWRTWSCEPGGNWCNTP